MLKLSKTKSRINSIKQLSIRIDIDLSLYKNHLKVYYIVMATVHPENYDKNLILIT